MGPRHDALRSGWLTAPEDSLVRRREEPFRESMRLLDDVSRELRRRGVEQWQPGEHEPAVRAQLDAEGWSRVLVLLLPDRDRVVGVCVLSDPSPESWAGREASRASYLSRLAIDPCRWGEGLGAVLIRRAAAELRARGRERLRLDCWSGNGTLRAYYARLGFRHLGDVDEASYRVSLFEAECDELLRHGSRGGS